MSSFILSLYWSNVIFCSSTSSNPCRPNPFCLMNPLTTLWLSPCAVMWKINDHPCDGDLCSLQCSITVIDASKMDYCNYCVVILLLLMCRIYSGLVWGKQKWLRYPANASKAFSLECTWIRKLIKQWISSHNPGSSLKENSSVRVNVWKVLRTDELEACGSLVACFDYFLVT